MTTERPILLKDEMVRAILDGRKTQTRRVMKPQPEGGLDFTPFAPFGVVNGKGNPLICRHGQPGDRLWVRETWQHLHNEGQKADEFEQWQQNSIDCFYLADESSPNNKPMSGRWRPSIHMPRWASRITLEITDVRVERLQDISNEDAVAEGIGTPCDMRYAALDAFKPLWESINGHDSWEANPWVWVIEFKRIPQEATQ
jgi:uncharacterized protein YhfF